MTVKSCGTASGRSIRCAPMFCLIVSPQHREASMAAQSHDLTSRTFAPNVCLSINTGRPLGNDETQLWAITRHPQHCRAVPGRATAP